MMNVRATTTAFAKQGKALRRGCSSVRVSWFSRTEVAPHPRSFLSSSSSSSSSSSYGDSSVATRKKVPPPSSFTGTVKVHWYNEGKTAEFEAGITAQEIRQFFGVREGGLSRRLRGGGVGGRAVILREPREGFPPGHYVFVTPNKERAHAATYYERHREEKEEQRPPRHRQAMGKTEPSSSPQHTPNDMSEEKKTDAAAQDDLERAMFPWLFEQSNTASLPPILQSRGASSLDNTTAHPHNRE
ncbi:hypothetical protein QOT17_014917 [Balamuthia mandrillaris]